MQRLAWPAPIVARHVDPTPIGIVITTLAGRYIEKNTFMLREFQMTVTLAGVVSYTDNRRDCQDVKV